MSVPDVTTAAQQLVAARLGLEVRDQRLSDLAAALEEGTELYGLADAGRYVDALATLPTSSAEWQGIVGRLTVGESYFFRDRTTTAALVRDVLPGLIAERRARDDKRLRLWSAGCAAGEEPYTLAILVDRLLPDRSDWAVTILATDIDARALEAARRGVYSAWSLRDTTEAERARYFQRRGKRYELDQRIRAMVEFAPLNLAADAYPTAVDVVVCRNVLMYFAEDARTHALERLERAVADRGWLALGASEASADALRPLTAVTLAGAMLYRRDAPGPPARATQPPAAAPAGRTSRPVALLRRARSHADAGRLEQASELCHALLAADRLDVEAYLLLATVERERGDVEAALAACRAAAYVAPDSATAHFLLGNLLLRQGADEPARQSLAAVAGLLDGVPSDAPVLGSGGVTAGRMLDAVRSRMEAAR